jgi:hypothetical protein
MTAMHVIAIGFPSALELLIILLVLLVPAGIILLLLRVGLRTSGQPKPSGFPVVDGPGTFLVIGVDRATRADKSITVSAASSENARVKAELDGVVVTEVRRVT